MLLILDRRRFLILILISLLLSLNIINLDNMRLIPPFVRQIFIFTYIIFVPGFLIIKNLRFNYNLTTMVLYSVGLSTSFLMFLGLIINFLFPSFGISKPLDYFPILMTINFIILILIMVCYSNDISCSFRISTEYFSQTLALLFLPLLAIFGTYFENFYKNNLILIVLLVVICLLMVSLAFLNSIPEKLYPFLIFIISISLLYHTSLLTNFLWGWDIHQEYYLANGVVGSHIWDPNLSLNVNSMLSIVILAPIFSVLCDLNLIYVFKIIYPALFSLVPVGLFLIFERQTNPRIALFSSFFFISFFVFYTEMLFVARQQIAELFAILILLLVTDKKVSRIPKAILAMTFGASLIVSHYGLSYIYLVLFIFAWAFSSFLGRYSFKGASLPNANQTVTFHYLLLFLVLLLTWYIFISNSTPFSSVVILANRIFFSVQNDLFNPETGQGLAIILLDSESFLYILAKYLHLLTILFICIGVIISFYKPKLFNFDQEYILMSYMSLFLCVLGIIIPYFASSLNTTRLYQISLINLAPFCIIGILYIYKLVNPMIAMPSCINKPNNGSFKFLSFFFVIYFLFNSGLIYELANDQPMSIALNRTVDYPRFNEMEFVGSGWLFSTKGEDHVYADYHRIVLLAEWNRNITYSLDELNSQNNKIYAYLGTINTENGEVATPKSGLIINQTKSKAFSYRIGYASISNLLAGKSKIYDNRGSTIYY